jgi:DNA-binding transcriptional LysR family regulator
VAAFSLIQLQYFLSVASLGSFAAAGLAENISPSAIASATTTLERSLGVQLLVRQRSKGVVLTPDGRWLAGEARRLLDSAETLSARATRSEQLTSIAS